MTFFNIDYKPQYELPKTTLSSNLTFESLIDKYMHYEPKSPDLGIGALEFKDQSSLLYRLLNIDSEASPKIIQIVNVLAISIQKGILLNYNFYGSLKELIRVKSFSNILKGQLVDVHGVFFSSFFLIDYFRHTCKNPQGNPWDNPQELIETIKPQLSKFKNSRILSNLVRLRIQDELPPVASVPSYAVAQFINDKKSALECLAFLVQHQFFDLYHRFYEDELITSRKELLEVIFPISEKWANSLKKLYPEITSYSATLHIVAGKSKMRALSPLIKKIKIFKDELNESKQATIDKLNEVTEFIGNFYFSRKKK